MAKLEPRFTLKRPNGTQASEIRLRICYNNKEFIYHLVDPVTHVVLKIMPQLWDKNTQLPVRKIPLSFQRDKANITLVRSLIERVKSTVDNIVIKSKVNGTEITNESLKKEIEVSLGIKAKDKPLTVADFILQVIEEMKGGKLLIEQTQKQYGKATIKQYVNLQKAIYYFDLLSESKTLFDTINQEWYDAFLNFLFSDAVYVGKGDEDNPEYERDACSTNYAGNFIKNLKRIMALAVERNITENRQYEASYFKKPSAPTFGVFLSKEEIKQIYDLPLEGDDKKLDNYRDMFLLGCYTGLRISDYTRLTKENFTETEKGNKVIDILTKKTEKKISLPILYPELIAIAEKYNYDFPKISAQKLNKAIKIIAKKAGINQQITYVNYKGNHAQEKIVEKWEIISSHTARRSTVTNLYLAGMNIDDIQIVTGQGCKEIVSLYNKASSHEKADILVEKFNSVNNGTNRNY